MTELLGLVELLAVSAALLVLLSTALLAREARRPPRHTAGWALARGLPCDPGDLALPFAQWTLDRPGGVALPVWEIDGQTLPSSAPPLTVVFIHGWGQSSIDMLKRIDPWPGLCDRLVMYDLRGHGDAEGGLTNLGCGEEDDLIALLDRLGPGRIVLAGHSMGAVIAIQAAAKLTGADSPIVAVVAYGPYCDFHRSLRGRLRASGLPGHPMTDLAILWFRLCGLRHQPTQLAARAVTCPMLIVHGENDIVSPPAHSEQLAEAASDAELHRVEGGGHLDTHEVDAPGHDAAIRCFIERILGDSG